MYCLMLCCIVALLGSFWGVYPTKIYIAQSPLVGSGHDEYVRFWKKAHWWFFDAGQGNMGFSLMFTQANSSPLLDQSASLNQAGHSQSRQTTTSPHTLNNWPETEYESTWSFYISWILIEGKRSPWTRECDGFEISLFNCVSAKWCPPRKVASQ